jgi:hypothetical protein
MFKFAAKHLARLAEWLFPRRADLYTVACLEDEPPSVEPRIVYVIGGRGNEWIAAMVCPCGCGQTIKLNLLAHESRPVWTVHPDRRKRATIVPSVWRHVGCRSHFIVRGGRIHWC